MLTFLLVVQAIVAVMLVGVILMQQSEGGGLGMGGSPTGLMSARGAADFLTRATTVLATIFIGLSILHAVLATRTGAGVSTIDTSLARPKAPVAPPPEPTVPVAGQPAPATNVLAPVTTAPAPVAVPMATARPKAEAERPRPAPARPAPRSAPATANVSAPPPVASTVTPSIPKATPTPAPSTTQGPPANSN
jgi:preprotein translocase subunit SecG